VADDEEVVALGVDDEVLERETKVRASLPSNIASPANLLQQARLQEEFFRANATAGNLQRERTPESDDEVNENVKARREADLNRERKIKRRLKRERLARGEVADDDDDDDDDDDEEDDEEDSLFGSVSCVHNAVWGGDANISTGRMMRVRSWRKKTSNPTLTPSSLPFLLQ
jgi:hypothetical protein